MTFEYRNVFIDNTSTVAAVSVAAHECGHAIQDKNNYFFLRFRNSIVPVVNLSSNLTLKFFGILSAIFSISDTISSI